jgi:hypothetical protein
MGRSGDYSKASPDDAPNRDPRLSPPPQPTESRKTLPQCLNRKDIEGALDAGDHRIVL